MDIYQFLIILTCVTSMITLFLVSVAVIPHVKQGLLVIRDAILWVAFVLVIAAAGFLFWQRIAERWTATRPRIRGDIRTTQTRSSAVIPGPTGLGTHPL